eukprot:COSAG06_NODE_2724_length_6384_cov_81.190135_7_plen_516_part_00
MSELLLRALVYFTDLFKVFDDHDLDKDHRLNEEEFVTAAAKMFHGKEEAQAAYAELATEHNSGHVLFYQFCDWCYSFHESLGLHAKTRLRPVSADTTADAKQAATNRRMASDGAKGHQVAAETSQGMVAPVAAVSASGVQIDGERLPVRWDSPRMRRSLAVLGVEPRDLLPKPEGWCQHRARARFKTNTHAGRISSSKAMAEACRQEQHEEAKRLELLSKVVMCRHSIVAARGKGLDTQSKTVQQSDHELNHYAIDRNHLARRSERRQLGVSKAPQILSPTRNRETNVRGRPAWAVAKSSPKATRTPHLSPPRTKLSPTQLALKQKIDARLKIALPRAQHRQSFASRRNSPHIGSVRVGVLDLGSCRIGDEGVRLLTEALRAWGLTRQAPLPLTAIHLDGNELTAKGARELTKMLAQKFAPPGLRVLNIQRNPSLGDNGIRTIVDKLPDTIQQLQLSGVGCGDAGIVALAARVASLRSLQQVTCASNDAVGERGWTELKAAWRRKFLDDGSRALV